MDGFPLPPARDSLSDGTAQTYTSHVPEHDGQSPLIVRDPSLPVDYSYYLPVHNNPGVANLKMNPMAIQSYPIPHYQYSPDMLQRSPSSYSPFSREGVMAQESYFAHRAVQAATYDLRNSHPSGATPYYPVPITDASLDPTAQPFYFSAR